MKFIIINFVDVCQGYEECIKDGHHGMCDISEDGNPFCQCKPGWIGEFCDEEETNTTISSNSFSWFEKKEMFIYVSIYVKIIKSNKTKNMKIKSNYSDL